MIIVSINVTVSAKYKTHGLTAVNLVYDKIQDDFLR